MNRIMNELYTFEDKTSDEVLLINGFQHINQLIPYINDLQKQNTELKDNWNKLKEGLRSLYDFEEGVISKDYLECVEDTLDKMQEIEGVMNE